jgi:hypothetical protein
LIMAVRSHAEDEWRMHRTADGDLRYRCRRAWKQGSECRFIAYLWDNCLFGS